MDQPLDDIEVRVLGSLLEKELATPDNYPLTLKALVAACNQTTSREPVMELDEAAVSRGLERLARRTFARGIHPSQGRVMRYRQEIGETLHLHRPERAILSVLMLRGPQTPGELRTRTARVVEFVDSSHVEIVLDSLAELSTPLVTALPRAPGQKEVRYAHLLAGAPSVDAPDPVPDDPPSRTSPVSASRSEGAVGSLPAERGDRADRGDRGDRIEALEEELASLRDEVAELRGQFQDFRRQFE
jgi:uncharacterized protein YceH (UPF0502 family)